MNTYTIYYITNKINGKGYIGITERTIKERFNEHISCALNTNKANLLYQAFRKYGIDNFSITLVEENIPFELGEEKERYYIEKFNTYYKNRNGYNMTIGGNGTVGYIFSDNAKVKMSERAKGRIFSEERNKKLSESLRGRKFSDEHKAKLSEAAKIKTGELNPFFNKHHTEETKRRIREARNDRLVLMLDNNTKNVLQEFDGIGEAADWVLENNLSTALKKTVMLNIGNVCRRAHQRVSCYGFDWKYKERCND